MLVLAMTFRLGEFCRPSADQVVLKWSDVRVTAFPSAHPSSPLSPSLYLLSLPLSLSLSLSLAPSFSLPLSRSLPACLSLTLSPSLSLPLPLSPSPSPFFLPFPPYPLTPTPPTCSPSATLVFEVELVAVRPRKGSVGTMAAEKSKLE